MAPLEPQSLDFLERLALIFRHLRPTGTAWITRFEVSAACLPTYCHSRYFRFGSRLRGVYRLKNGVIRVDLQLHLSTTEN